MRLCSTKNSRLSATFLEAVERGSPGDGGLYVPGEIPTFSTKFIRALHGCLFKRSHIRWRDFSLTGKSQLCLRRIIEESITFPAPLHALDEHTAVLELFHGPTLAFKDFGARFMARVMTYLHSNDHAPTTVLVATSGDTGSAVAHGFQDAEGISVVLLYPSGRVAPMQELQLQPPALM